MLTKQVQQKKLVMMTENGPIPNIETCMKAGIKWGIFMGWNDLVFSQNTIQHILDVYNSPYVITL